MTKATKIAELKALHQTISVGSDEIGYTELSAKDYETTIEKWAQNLIEIETKESAIQNAKASAEAKLAALGLTADDLKALGL